MPECQYDLPKLLAFWLFCQKSVLTTAAVFPERKKLLILFCLARFGLVWFGFLGDSAESHICAFQVLGIRLDKIR